MRKRFAIVILFDTRRYTMNVRKDTAVNNGPGTIGAKLVRTNWGNRRAPTRPRLAPRAPPGPGPARPGSAQGPARPGSALLGPAGAREGKRVADSAGEVISLHPPLAGQCPLARPLMH